MVKLMELIKEEKADVWLLTDVLGRDVLTGSLLGQNTALYSSRRWFYLLYRDGRMTKLVSRIESRLLDHLPGNVVTYTGYDSMKGTLAKLLDGCECVAMQYSPECILPYITTADAGMVETIRLLGKQVISSADMVQRQMAILTPEQMDSHKRAGTKILAIRDTAYQAVRCGIDRGNPLTEYQLRLLLEEEFQRHNLVTQGKDSPYVAADKNSSNQTYIPSKEHSLPIVENTWLLLDLWAKENAPDSIYHDVTFCAYTGQSPPKKCQELFSIVAEARDQVILHLQVQGEKGIPVTGMELDQIARSYITQQGYGSCFHHRTGHSIGTQCHYVGANLDSFESKDFRRILPGTCFSVEPGIYTQDIGVRTEINVVMSPQCLPKLYCESQNEIHCI